MKDHRSNPRVTLSMAQRHKLNVWVTEHSDDLNGMYESVAAKLATNSLGFNVTPTNLRTTRKAVGTKFRLVNDKAPSYKAKNGPTYKDLSVLAAAITDLYSTFGAELPYSVREAAARFDSKTTE